MEQLTILNLGCGRRKDLPPWAKELEMDDGSGGEVRPDATRVIHVDEMPSVNPDLVCKLGTDRLRLEDDSVDVAFAMHVIEHIGRQGELGEWFTFWQDLYRVLKPGARLYFESPYHTSLWAWADPTHTRAISEYTFLYLGQNNYRVGGSIPDYRPLCDFVLESWSLKPDVGNPDVVAKERNGSHIRGVLRAVKPFVPYWTD